MVYIFFLFIIIALFLEGTVTTLPLVFICLVLMTIIMRNLFLFVLAFIAGLFLDAFAIRPIGTASIFLLICILLMILYQRKYEINSYPFVLIATFIGSFVYLLVFGYGNSFILACLSSFLAVILFASYRYSIQKFSS